MNPVPEPDHIIKPGDIVQMSFPMHDRHTVRSIRFEYNGIIDVSVDSDDFYVDQDRMRRFATHRYKIELQLREMEMREHHDYDAMYRHVRINDDPSPEEIVVAINYLEDELESRIDSWYDNDALMEAVELHEWIGCTKEELEEYKEKKDGFRRTW